MRPGVIIVSNRLPVSVKKVDGKLEFYPSVGGLATGLSSYARNRRNKWIGWPGVADEDVTETEKRAIARELRKHNCYPVFLTRQQLEDYYNGYSNTILWPLFHDMKADMTHHDRQWRAYQQVNQLFAEEVLALSVPGSTIWVHDYQLLTLPALLREQRPTDRIGFFLHIPFPDSDHIQKLPSALPLLEGVLGSDLVGFHTPSYVEKFLSACTQLETGLVTDHQVVLENHVARITQFPIGIDYAKFARAAKLRPVKREVARLKRKYRGRKLILTVDRLDPTKGLVERLEAYRTFLSAHPHHHGKVVMTMLAVPSRTDIAEYKQLKQRLESLVETVNSEFGTRSWQPVEYMYQSLPFEQLTALYQVADVAFIAPIRDGMNLVAKEYIASKPKHNGVLILSSTAGAAEEMTEALIVDPARPHTLVDALASAITMPRTELKRRVRAMQAHIEEHTIHGWAGSFMQSLQHPPTEPRRWTRTLTPVRRNDLTASYRAANSRVVFLDYDGVLAPFVSDPSKAKPSAAVYRVIDKLSAQPGTNVVIISGRRKDDLLDWFGELPVALVAEHGAVYRRAGGKTWRHSSKAKHGWQKQVTPILQEYAELTPGAFVEIKDYALVWHYRNASPYYAQKHLVLIKRQLRRLLRTYNLEMVSGNKVLEIRPRNVNKGTATTYWLRDDVDFIMAIGDDATDEDMFEALPRTAHTIKVGRGRTDARYRVHDTTEVRELLKQLSK